MDWADHLPDVEETKQRRRDALAKFRTGEDFSLLASLKTTNAFVAGIGLHPLDWKVPKFEIGYWCRMAYQSQGYVTEAVRALTQTGFEVLGAKRIQICCDARNLRSRRVAEKAGYSQEATLKDDMLAPDGKLRDTVIYTLLPGEYARLSLKS